MLSEDVRQPTTTKDELNLVEYPFSLPCHRHPKGKQVIHLSEQIKDPQGKPKLREWIVTGSSLHGLPLAIDEEVFLCVMYFLSQNNFETREIHFTQYNFLKRLDWSTNDRAYQRLKQCLDRLRGVVIESRGTFWDHRAKCYITKSFNLIDGYSLYDKETGSGDQPFLSSVTVSDFILQSINSGFVKTLNFDFYRSLHLPIARKLFRVLDKKLHNGDIFEADLMRLAQRLAITDSLYPSKVKQNLKGPHAELIDRGVIKSAKFIRRGKSASVRYTITPRSTWKNRKPVAADTQVLRQQHPLVVELIARGITPDVARDLLAAYGEKKVAEKLEVFDDLVAGQSQTISKSPAGFLRHSIEKDFAPPAGYVSRAERRRRKDEEAEAQRRQREFEKARDAAEAERQAKFEALWSSLTETDRQTLEAQVLQTLNSFTRKAYEKEKADGRKGAAHHTLRTGIADLLAARDTANATEESQ